MSDEVYKYRDYNMWFCGTCLPQLRDIVKKGLVSEWERDATETTTGIRELCEPKENVYAPLTGVSLAADGIAVYIHYSAGYFFCLPKP